MLPKTEMQAIAQKINLDLFNRVTNFILDTAKATHEQVRELNRRCFLRTIEPPPQSMSEKYDFLYLGELLERYEERFGMPDTDLRAIALALGFTNALLTPNMFVGNQKYVFLDRVKKEAENDLYLAGALCLMEEDASPYENTLMNREYTNTEEIIFSLSVLPDFSQAFASFMPQMLRLLGKDRTMPVLENSKIFDWFIVQLIPILKSYRGKDAALFRALCALPRSFVRPGCKEYTELASNGYTSLEIAYLNMMCVQSQMADKVLRTGSIVTTKIAVRFFQEVVSQQEPFTPEMYEWLTELYSQYAQFPKLCYGTHYLMDAISDGAALQNADTFSWLYRVAELHHPIFECFDILDAKWDKLVETLDHPKYKKLFQMQLSGELSKDEIRAWVARYDTLTGTSYVTEVLENSSFDLRLLVRNEIVDLWDAFCGCLDENGNIANGNMLNTVARYLSGNFNLQIFCFYEKFFGQYGMPDLEKYFKYEYTSLFRGMYKLDSYYQDKLTFCEDYLDAEMQRTLLGWLQDYIFTYEPEKYLKFALLILLDKQASEWLTPTELRPLFDQLVGHKELNRYEVDYLKQQYLNPEELAAEQEAEAAAERLRQREAEMAREKEIRAGFLLIEHTFPKAYSFLNSFRNSPQDGQTACSVVREQLDDLLSSTDYCLDEKNLVGFLKVCGMLVENSALEIGKLQEYIKMIKEDVTNDNDCDEAC